MIDDQMTRRTRFPLAISNKSFWPLKNFDQTSRVKWLLHVHVCMLRADDSGRIRIRFRKAGFFSYCYFSSPSLLSALHLTFGPFWTVRLPRNPAPYCAQAHKTRRGNGKCMSDIHGCSLLNVELGSQKCLSNQLFVVLVVFLFFKWVFDKVLIFNIFSYLLRRLKLVFRRPLKPPFRQMSPVPLCIPTRYVWQLSN